MHMKAFQMHPLNAFNYIALKTVYQEILYTIFFIKLAKYKFNSSICDV